MGRRKRRCASRTRGQNHMDLLLVEDNPTDRMVMQTRLRRAFPKARIHVADEPDQLREYLRLDTCDVVVTDYWLGWSDGLSVLQRVRERWPRARVIIVTGNGGEEVVAGALKFGLFNYLLKPEGFEDLVSVTKAAFESKRREDALELRAAILNSVPDSLECMDAEGTVVTTNDSARRLFGYSEETVGQRFEILLSAQLRAQIHDMYAQVLSGSIVPPFAAVRERRDGTSIPVQMSLVPIRGDRGKIAWITCISNPIGVTQRETVNQTADVATQHAGFASKAVAT